MLAETMIERAIPPKRLSEVWQSHLGAGEWCLELTDRPHWEKTPVMLLANRAMGCRWKVLLSHLGSADPQFGKPR